MNFETIRWEKDHIVLIDQTRLPAEYKERVCKDVEELHEAIRVLAVRGAPLLGVAAAFGLYVGIKNYKGKIVAEFLNEVQQVADYIKTSRPTAVNLFWALERMIQKAQTSQERSIEKIKHILFEEAQAIKKEDQKLCRSIGEHGEALIDEGDVVLTHCNAGALATAGIGTALAPLYVAHKKGKKFNVYADETRPLLQGARLTCWELAQNGIEARLICDSMAASLMGHGVIRKIITGADRIAQNGDAANKIGTYGVAVLAHHHHIPFYIAAPYSTFDPLCRTGEDIPIEERSSNELRYIGKTQIAPEGIKTYNPAFDVTPHELITGFITEKGIFGPPYDFR